MILEIKITLAFDERILRNSGDIERNVAAAIEEAYGSGLFTIGTDAEIESHSVSMGWRVGDGE